MKQAAQSNPHSLVLFSVFFGILYNVHFVYVMQDVIQEASCLMKVLVRRGGTELPNKLHK